ncbi:MAG: AAA family ATPase [Magnetococcales bacterium]|nr:AAA family ATPase [Magnetococcales bacterium]
MNATLPATDAAEVQGLLPEAGNHSTPGLATFLEALGLARTPFPVVPDAANLFKTEWMAVSFAEVVDAVNRRKGFIAITGEVGLGKSTFSRALLNYFYAQDIHVSLVLNSFLQGVDLLRGINRDFDLAAEGETLLALMDELTDFLLREFGAGRNCVILIDDTQNLTLDSLEMIRQISNLETETHKLVQIILVGQTELETTLRLPAMRQLHSRLALHKRIIPLTREELVQFVHYKLERAGNEKQLTMSRGAFGILFKETQGNPRKVSRLMDRCLYALIALRRFKIDSRLIRKVVGELNQELNPLPGSYPTIGSKSRSSSWMVWVFVGVLGALLLIQSPAFLSLKPLGDRLSLEKGWPVLLNEMVEWWSPSSGLKSSREIPALAQAPDTRDRGVAPITAGVAFSTNQEAPITSKVAPTPEREPHVEMDSGKKPAEPAKSSVAAPKDPFFIFTKAYHLERFSAPLQQAIGEGTLDQLGAQIEGASGLRLIKLPAIPAFIAGRFSLLRIQEGVGEYYLLFSKPDFTIDDLHLFSSGEKVTEMAQKLKRLGYDPGPDKKWGNIGLMHALARFQQAMALEATGRLDDATLFLLSQAEHRT